MRLAQNEAGHDVARGTRMRRLALGFVPLFALGGLTFLPVLGCTDKDSGLERLSPRTTPYLTGVPVPARFSLVDKNSEDIESGSPRFARHNYRGSAPLMAIRNFYREQMPLNGWNRVSDQNVKGIVHLRFEKGNEACTVQINPSGFFNWCTIQVVVMPFSRTSMEPPSRRPMP
jgi:hypothetical protein